MRTVHRQSRRLIVVLALGAALALPTAATAISAVAVANHGSLKVLSSVVVTPRTAELMGGWLNPEQSCQAERRLRVSIELTRFRPDGSHGASVFNRVTRRVTNCAEGGPNLGFQYRASDFSEGFGCADGRWRPGDYDALTRTRDLRSDVVSIATLSFTRRAPC